MFKHFPILVGLILALPCAQARDTHHMYSIEEALNSPAAEAKIDDSIKLYFGDQKHPPVKETLDRLRTNKKTNAFNKTDKEACEWVFLSAIIALQNRAADLGADAIVNIRSNYKDKEVSSATEFKCGAGKLMAGVAFKGDAVKLAE